MKTLSAICLAIVLTTAVAICYGVAVTVAYTAWEDVRSRQSGVEPRMRKWEALVVYEDGQVTIWHGIHRRGEVWSPDDRALDVHRQPVTRTPSDGRVAPAHLSRVTRPSWRDYSGLNALVIRLGIQTGDAGNEDWFFVYNDRTGSRGRFEVYDLRTRRLLGALGIAGFKSAPLDEEDMIPIDGARLAAMWDDFQRNYGDYNYSTIHFDGRYPISLGQLVMKVEDGLVLIDLTQRTIQRLLPEDTVLSADVASRLERLPDDFQPRGPQEEDDRFLLRQYLAVRTPQRVILLHPNDAARSEIPIPEGLADRDFELYLTSDGGAIFTASAATGWEQVGPNLRNLDQDLWRVSPDGNVTRRETVTLQERGRSTNVESLVPLVIPMPAVSLTFCGLVFPWITHIVQEEPFRVSAREMLSASWPMQLLVILISAGLAYAADRHRTAHRLPRSWGWVAFVFLFGLPGFAAYLLHRRWPLRDVVPAPQPTGAEVFA